MSSLDRVDYQRSTLVSNSSSITRLYARLLQIQAKLQFPYEKSLYDTPAWKAARTVVDFGCGDASYLMMLAKEFPDKRYFGVESNPEILDLARRKLIFSDHEISLHSSIDDIGKFSADFIVMRYVVMHLVDRQSVFQSLARLAAPGASVLVIEPDDSMYEAKPAIPLLDEALREIKAVSRDRNLKEALDLEIMPFGFLLSSVNSKLISDNSPGHEMMEYLEALIELGLQRRLSELEAWNLLDWSDMNNRYLRFGFYGRLYNFSEA